MFNFGSKKLQSYPYRLMMFYFATACIFSIVLLSEITFYVLLGLNLMIAIFVIVENPFTKITLEYIDSVSKPIISLICLVAIKIMSMFSTQMVFIPIGIFSLLSISVIMSIVRMVKVKINRANIAQKILDESG